MIATLTWYTTGHRESFQRPDGQADMHPITSSDVTNGIECMETPLVDVGWMDAKSLILLILSFNHSNVSINSTYNNWYKYHWMDSFWLSGWVTLMLQLSWINGLLRRNTRRERERENNLKRRASVFNVSSTLFTLAIPVRIRSKWYWKSISSSTNSFNEVCWLWSMTNWKFPTHQEQINT